MSKVDALVVFFGITSLLLTSVGASKCRQTAAKVLSASMCGVGMLGLLTLLAPFSGISVSLNWFTSFVAVVLGAPGVITMLVLRALFSIG